MLSRYSFSKYFTRSNIIQFLVLSLLSQILILIITFVITSKLEAIGFSFLLFTVLLSIYNTSNTCQIEYV
nr:Uncharacterized protein A9P81_1293 [Leptospira interrogans serovar Copenhageni/Icterohaemorrhagiae]